MANTVIQVQNVSKSYWRDSFEVPVLNDITIEVNEGEFLRIDGAVRIRVKQRCSILLPVSTVRAKAILLSEVWISRNLMNHLLQNGDHSMLGLCFNFIICFLCLRHLKMLNFLFF